MRSGRRLAIDVGKVRVGFAISDFHGILASPLTTIAREDLIDSIEALQSSVEDFEGLLEIYVGLPINMEGEMTSSTDDAIRVASQIANSTSIPVRLIDERLTTSLANQQLRSLGKSQKDARSTIDQMAAVAILEYAFQIEANSNTAPGISLEDWREKND
ncbi:MAG: Holliday junction resolvase RuvX [Actinomycetota bacterium]